MSRILGATKGNSGLPGSLAIAVVLAAAVLTALSGPARTAEPEGQDRTLTLPNQSSAAREVAPLVATLWQSAFFRRNDAVQRELLGIDFVFFDPSPGMDKRAIACFVPGKGGRDRIYLRRDVLAHWDLGPEVIHRPSVSPRILAIIVHEFCHDLWSNVLDERDRAAFLLEGDGFVGDYALSLTPEEQRDFLMRAGEQGLDPRRFRAFAHLETMRTMYPRTVLCGQELFAWFAERLFASKEKIPRSFAKYYVPILGSVIPDKDTRIE